MIEVDLQVPSNPLTKEPPMTVKPFYFHESSRSFSYRRPRWWRNLSLSNILTIFITACSYVCSLFEKLGKILLTENERGCGKVMLGILAALAIVLFINCYQYTSKLDANIGISNKHINYTISGGGIASR